MDNHSVHNVGESIIPLVGQNLDEALQNEDLDQQRIDELHHAGLLTQLFSQVIKQ